MECTATSTQVVYTHRERNNVYKSDYSIDFWKEVKKRWMVPGVLATVALAVLAPKYGAPGGIFRTEYTTYLPRTYIYYAAGRTRMHACRPRMFVLTALHAHVGAFLLSVVNVNALSVALDRRVVEGAVLLSLSRPCGWLPLSLSSTAAGSSTLAAATYAASFLFSPLAHLLLCGRIPLPSIQGVMVTATTALVPFAVGHLFSKTDNDTEVAGRLCALLLLYADCCALLREAEGSLLVLDVVATLFLVISWLSTVAASSYLYVRCGLLTSTEARLLLLLTTPRSTHVEWVSSAGCSASGLARLPAVFAAPAQALLLAALEPAGGEGGRLP